MQQHDSLLFAKLNLETAKIPWRELQRFFAQGKVLLVDEKQDIVSIAELMANNDADQVNTLIQEQKIKLVSDDQAKIWINNDQLVWAVVVAPWVLVQQAD